MKTKVGLLGFGRTGKNVANLILQDQNYQLEWVFRKSKVLEKRSVPDFFGIQSEEPGHIYSAKTTSIDFLLDAYPVEFIIDFSAPEVLHTYAYEAAKRNVKIISAISHYSESEINLLHDLSADNVIFWSPNITLGVNFLLLASKYLKEIAPSADIEIIEEHFKKKSGISGTALKIAESLHIGKSNVLSVRAGGIVGKHEIIFGFPYQTVRLTHESISREAFGNGALFVAQELKDKIAGFYTFEDLLLPYFSKKSITK
ncbi:MAG: dihydrodipicolinate reductase [Ignavibacteria bacterium GWF2_33_9]|nr:MAG: dihydrodipicolinate reductase [Ignavibacteria bacterium GWF2_33_9]